jgi:DUF438 domain-containing protein
MIEKIKSEILEAMLSALPVDFTFIDEDDRIQFFNKNNDRIFTRPSKIIGKKVHDCHPERVLHMLQRVIDEMKDGSRESAEFWIDRDEMKVYIKFIAVKSGCHGHNEDQRREKGSHRVTTPSVQ